MLDFKQCPEDAPAGRKVRGIDACLSKTEGAREPRALICLMCGRSTMARKEDPLVNEPPPDKSPSLPGESNEGRSGGSANARMAQDSRSIHGGWQCGRADWLPNGWV